MSTGNVQRLVREGNFPKPRALSVRRVGWLVSEIEEWAMSRPVAEMLPPINVGRRRES
ncbi:helix-turn-helix transcriptional regulator [Paraburkholderia denitrificans]|uniref:Helix-turn-helix transcriptional regulator n=1 Tax=Paraburkholderia denitrificans TaxID=694025 RepID=A0ABW0J3P8_9BURK